MIKTYYIYIINYKIIITSLMSIIDSKVAHWNLSLFPTLHPIKPMTYIISKNASPLTSMALESQLSYITLKSSAAINSSGTAVVQFRKEILKFRKRCIRWPVTWTVLRTTVIYYKIMLVLRTTVIYYKIMLVLKQYIIT